MLETKYGHIGAVILSDADCLRKKATKAKETNEKKYTHNKIIQFNTWLTECIN